MPAGRPTSGADRDDERGATRNEDTAEMLPWTDAPTDRNPRLSAWRRRLGSLLAVALAAGGATVLPAAAAAPPMYPGDLEGRFVDFVYMDLFGRGPDPDGRLTWVRELSSGTARVAVANGITGSREYRARLVGDAYHDYLGRGFDPQGLQSWLVAMDRGATIEQIQAGFIASDEYYAAAGGTPSGWVVRLYRNVLGRTAAPGEITSWTRELVHGASRTQVALGFLLSSEHLTAVVDGYYVHLLGRHIDPVGRQGWVSALQAGGRDENIIGGIIASGEYWQITAGSWGDTLVVSPSVAVIAPGQTQSFTAKVYRADGSLRADVTSSAVFQLGTWTACPGGACRPTVPGQATLTVRSRGDVGTASALVTASAVDHLTVTAAPASAPSGESFYLTAVAVGAGGDSLGDVTAWTAFDADGDATACTGATCSPTGVGAHALTAHAAGAQGAATVQVTAPGPAGAQLFGWGDNRFGAVGLPTLGPAQVGRIGVDTHWAQVAAGVDHTVALKTDGSLWAWGRNRYGQLGTGDTTDRAVPTRIGSGTSWVSVFAEHDDTFAIRADGTLWGWGLNSVGQLGVANLGDQPTPVQLGGTGWESVAAETFSTYATKADGTLWEWGYGVGLPSQVGVDSDWVAVAAGWQFAAALKADGTLWTWGRNDEGQLGDGTTTDRSMPAQVGAGTHWASVRSGDSFMVALASDGTLWGWGSNYSTILGPTPGVWTRPTRVGTGTWLTVDASWNVLTGVRPDGTLWSWGYDPYSTLPGHARDDVSVPVQIAPGAWSGVVAGPYHMVAWRS